MRTLAALFAMLLLATMGCVDRYGSAGPGPPPDRHSDAHAGPYPGLRF